MAASTTRAQIASTLGLVLRAAQAAEREDLLVVLGGIKARLAATPLAVLVAGEVGHGKTTVVEALTDTGQGRIPAATSTVTAHERPGDDGAPACALIDTPGIGAHPGADHATAELPRADVVVFVTSARSELTASQLAYLDRAHQLVSHTVVVVTHTDLYPHWHAVTEKIRRQVGEMPATTVFATAAELHRLGTAVGDASLRQESGIAELAAHLDELAAASEQVRQLAMLRGLGHTVDRLIEDQVAPEPPPRRGRWQQVLGDRLADLNVDIDHRLRAQTRDLAKLVDDLVEHADPAAVWDDVVAELGQGFADAITDIELRLRDGIVSMADAVAESFGSPHDVHAEHVTTETPPGAGPNKPDLIAESVAAQSLVALRGSYSGIAMTAMAGQLMGLTLFGPAALVAGVVLGTKTIRDDRKRHLANRRAVARQALRSHLDEAHTNFAKDVRDRIRAVGRELRDHYTELATAPAPSAPADTADEMPLESLRTRIRRLSATVEATPR